METTEQIDIQVENHGSIWLLRPMSPFGADWLEENIHEPMYFGDAVACEPRYAAPVIRAMMDEGLEVR